MSKIVAGAIIVIRHIVLQTHIVGQQLHLALGIHWGGEEGRKEEEERRNNRLFWADDHSYPVSEMDRPILLLHLLLLLLHLLTPTTTTTTTTTYSPSAKET